MRIFIAETNKDLRVGWQFLLHQEPGFQVIGVADNGKGLQTHLQISQPDVLLLDWYLPGVPLAELIAEIRAHDSQLKIIVTSIRPDDSSAVMASGANNFVVKNSPPDNLINLMTTMRSTPTINEPFTGKGE